MTTTTTAATIRDLVPAFDAMKPAVAADFVQYVTKLAERMAAEYTTREMRTLSGSFSGEGNLYRVVRHFLVTHDSIGRPTERATVNHEAIAKASVRYADDQIAAFTGKLTRKLGNLHAVEVQLLDVNAFRFHITGALSSGERVAVHQTRIINCSPKGTLFHQWPARIYVNGKATSEAAFKRLAAA